MDIATFNSGRGFFEQPCAFCYQRAECVSLGALPFLGKHWELAICRNCSRRVMKNIVEGWQGTGVPLTEEGHQAPAGSPENGAARLLKLLTGHELEDEYLDDLSTYGLTAELATLIKRAKITEEMLGTWEQEKSEQFIGWKPAEGGQAQEGNGESPS